MTNLKIVMTNRLTGVHLEGEDIAKIRQIYQRVVDRVLEIELKRGDSMTSATKLAGRLVLVHGAVTFISILKVLAKIRSTA